MDNTLELKTINELQEMSFLIPSYQCGYRWSDKEVTDLLDDISEFTPKEVEDTDDKTWYCLQPIVVRKRNEEQYEVIDGQQRLTTTYLILYYLHQRYKEESRGKIFRLNYETRNNVHSFLAELKKNEIIDDNIDYYFISLAYSTICNWFNKKNFNINDFESKFKFYTKVIWYESNEDNPIAIFTRINIGKIPLTNAELIKALFLNSSNFKINKHDKVWLKQLEISTEWDRIEHTLQDDMFWYFINEDRVSTNRIELIFNLMNTEKDEDDNYSTFRFFNKKFKNKEAIEENWLEVKDYFQRFQEWFSDRELYHKIGFLIIEGETIAKLIAESANKTKTEFKKYLNDSIKEKIKDVNLEELQYGDKKIKTVLLLYNIQTMLNSEKDNSHFPFDIFKKDKWDIEHITSVKDKVPDSKQQKENWLNDAKDFIDKKDADLFDEVSTYKINDNFNELYEKIVTYFNQNLKDEDINDISNLTLLDSETNRGYKNAVFPVKRKTIIQREKEGTFIPLCTKNTFLKYFSEYPPKMSFWTQEDRDNYFKDLERVLSIYLPSQKEDTCNE